MFNIIISSHQNRAGRSTAAKILSKLLKMPKTSGGDMHRLFAMEYFMKLERGQLVKEFIEKQDLDEIIKIHGNISSEQFVEYHEHIIRQDPNYDVEIDKQLMRFYLAGGWIADSVTSVSLIHYLTDKNSKVYEEFVEKGDLNVDDAKEIQKNSVLVYFIADINERAKRSVEYENKFGKESTFEKEKELLERREQSNKERYKELYNFEVSDGPKWADIVIDSSKLNPIEICTEICKKSDKIQERLKELRIEDYQAEITKIADW